MSLMGNNDHHYRTAVLLASNRQFAAISRSSHSLRSRLLAALVALARTW
jgi:hypothetical protein